MIRFECDYAEGCQPEILDLLTKTNFEQTPGYGGDEYTEKAARLIKKACECPNADVHFTIGGTHTNKTVIRSMLRDYEGVISVESGHVEQHETGTIEQGGHKVLTAYSLDGKLKPEHIRKIVENHQIYGFHMVKPGMVYVSNPTENGTMYSKAELTRLREVCDEYGLPLYLDGARMGYGLYARGNDLTMADYAKLCDVFYIGGTKVGALFGEAIVIVNDKFKPNFKYFIKQNGALLAKGRLLGIQFIPLFDERDLYRKGGKHRMDLAVKLQDCFEECGLKDHYGSTSNQLFPEMPRWLYEKLGEKYAFSYTEKIDDDNAVIRFCTSWATKESDVDELIRDLKNIFACENPAEYKL